MFDPNTQPDLPSLTVSALLVPMAFSSWLIRHSDVEAAAQPSFFDHAQRVDDRRPYLDAPLSDTLADAVALPSEEDGVTVNEFSFRAAWETTRSIEHLPPAWRSVYRKYNRVLAEQHDLSMSSGGAHRYTRIHESIIRTPPSPTTLTHAMTAASASGRASDMRARIYRRLGIVRCSRTNRFARDPDSSWTSHGGLDRRVRWAHT
jgi:hypothetical protein